MKFIIAALLWVAVAQNVEGKSAPVLKPRTPLMPVNPRYSPQERNSLPSRPENLPLYVPGDSHQEESASKSANLPDARIINGAAASVGQFPWQVQLIMDQREFCGGSLISSSWVLTAAHCANGAGSFVVTLGGTYVNSRQPGSVTVESRSSVVNQAFDPEQLVNDVALVQLPYSIPSSGYIDTIRLPSYSESTESFVGQNAVISGWGRTSDDNDGLSSVLEYVSQTVISNQQCAQTYGAVIDQGKICVTGYNAQSTCNVTNGLFPLGLPDNTLNTILDSSIHSVCPVHSDPRDCTALKMSCDEYRGDSGGPLVLQDSDGLYTQVGIVSFGPQAGCTLGYPTAYTRVSQYLQWISTYSGVRVG